MDLSFLNTIPNIDYFFTVVVVVVVLLLFVVFVVVVVLIVQDWKLSAQRRNCFTINLSKTCLSISAHVAIAE